MVNGIGERHKKVSGESIRHCREEETIKSMSHLANMQGKSGRQQSDSGLNGRQDKNQKEKMPTSSSHGMPNTRSTVHFLKNGENPENLTELPPQFRFKGRIL